MQNQPAGATVKLSHFKISKWEGKYEPAIASAGATNADLLFFINHDKAGGKVQGISDGKLDVSLGGNVLHVPCERVRQIDFAQLQRRGRTARPVGGSRRLSRRRQRFLPIGKVGRQLHCRAQRALRRRWPSNPAPSAKWSLISTGPEPAPPPPRRTNSRG